MNTLSKLARNFRSRVGESRASLEQHETPLAEATTPSLDALKAYSMALRVHYSSGATAALPLFKRAVEIDPKFAMAHAWLGRTYANLDQSDLTAESIQHAWELQDRVSDREKFAIATRYRALVTGNLEDLRQTSETWVRTYPRDPQPHIGLAIYYRAMGKFEKAVAEAGKAIEVDPDFGIGYHELASEYVRLDRWVDAAEALRSAAARGLKMDEFLMLEHDIAFLRGDLAGMQQAAARARQKAGADNWISSKEALALACSGRLRQARIASEFAVNQARLGLQQERAGLWMAQSALREALFGNVAEARKQAEAALDFAKSRDVEIGAAFALALAGDSARSGTLADDLEKRFPEDTSVRFSYVPVIRARRALNQNEPSKAFELLEPARPTELGAPHGNFGTLYPVYVRGEAYLACNQGAEAAAEFRKILDHRGLVGSDPIGPLARLQLGRALALAGDRSHAQAAYRDLLTLWHEADPNIPVYQQAKTENGKL